jgi:hypothetical protein
MNATTEATKLNFMTDHGSTRDKVSMAWRLDERRTLGPCFFLLSFFLSARFCHADVTAPAIPAAAPVTAAPAAPVENPAPEPLCAPPEEPPGAADGPPGAAVSIDVAVAAEPDGSRPVDRSVAE